MPLTMSSTSGGLVYETAAVDYGPIRKFVSTSGPVRALVTVSVGSQLSGQISELKADFNTEVKAGDELAVIDDKTFVARVAQAEADLAAAKAMLANHEAALLKAEAIERNAERLLERQQTLAGKGIAATTTLDNATRDAEVASAEVAIAKAQVENAKATIAQREAQLAQAEIDLERTRIRSPIDGTVIARTVDVGQTVAASLQAPELFKIAQDLRRIRIEAQVSEADVGTRRRRQSGRVQGRCLPAAALPGQGRAGPARRHRAEQCGDLHRHHRGGQRRSHAAARHDRRGQDRERQRGASAAHAHRRAALQAARRGGARRPRATRRSSGSTASWSGSSARWRLTERAGGEGRRHHEGRLGRAERQAGSGRRLRPAASGRRSRARPSGAFMQRLTQAVASVITRCAAVRIRGLEGAARGGRGPRQPARRGGVGAECSGGAREPPGRPRPRRRSLRRGAGRRAEGGRQGGAALARVGKK